MYVCFLTTSADCFPYPRSSSSLTSSNAGLHLACSRRSDSRARQSVGSELNCTPGKWEGGWGDGVSPSVFFLPEFFSRALLSERLEQASLHLK